MKNKAIAGRQSSIITFRERKGAAYPNQAERSYFLGKAVDYALTVATSLGAVTILLFLIVLG